MPKLAPDSHGGALALWVNDIGAGKHLYGQDIGADARLLGDSFALIAGAGNQQYPNLDGDGTRFLLTWQSDADGNWDTHAALTQPEQVTVIAYSYDPLYRLTAAILPPTQLDEKRPFPTTPNWKG